MTSPRPTNKQPNNFCFNEVPDELWLNAFSFLPVRSLFTSSRTNKTFYQLTDESIKQYSKSHPSLEDMLNEKLKDLSAEALCQAGEKDEIVGLHILQTRLRYKFGYNGRMGSQLAFYEDQLADALIHPEKHPNSHTYPEQIKIWSGEYYFRLGMAHTSTAAYVLNKNDIWKSDEQIKKLKSKLGMDLAEQTSEAIKKRLKR